jgi:hypothetical protein
VIAALFVETGGAYFGLEGVDPWDERRDARTYAGPHPVVAHPPCARWCALAGLVEHLLGDEYRVGEDDGCFEAALEAVHAYGGVLEHPANSLAWRRFGLPRPARGGWQGNLELEGWCTEVDQAAYGHPARKRTWLYAVGVDSLPALDWSSPAVSRKVAGFTHQTPGEPHVSMEEWRVRPREASATPPAFRDVLVELARSAERVAA